ncbi:MAG: hypothetical protein KDC46_09655 [Thermoleophilia bacterium]|nr:hypothetical protein [Thermoleophilia bacterium]
MFDPHGPANRDDVARPYRDLQSRIADIGGEFHTLDVFEDRGQAPDVVLFLEVPPDPVERILRWCPNAVPWAALQECEVVLPRNWVRSRHEEFDRIFTWNDTWVDQSRYFKLNFPNPIPTARPSQTRVRDRFAALIAGNKRSAHEKELYSERVSTVRWYELNHPELLDLYGLGWDVHPGAGPLSRRLEGPIRRAIRRPAFPSWRGTVVSKLETLESYRFCICYENARDIPGYITEKIFDCFFAGTIPVYWGAPNISTHVDPASFIDRRKFSTHEALHEFLTTLDDSEVAAYRAAGADFVKSHDMDQFSSDGFVDTLMKHLDHRPI